MYQRILVPTDGSDHADWAGAHAVHLAAAFDATVTLLNVVDLDAEAGPFSAGGIDSEYVSRLEDKGRETVQAAASALAADVEMDVVTGRPAEAILEYTDEQDVDLVVMGTHGRTGVQRYVMGSVTERVVSLAEVPVLTVRGRDGERVTDYDEILIPTDGSEAAATAIEHGLAVAERFDARIHAVNVVHIGAATTSPDLSLSPELLSALESSGETVTEAIADRAEAAGLDTVTAVREGTPAGTLLDYVDETNIDLVAMGTAGRTGLSRYLLGSTTERVIRRSEAPVLAVNARHHEED